MSKQRLLDSIAAAFANVPLGEGVGLFEGRALDDYDDPKPARERDEKLNWPAISDADLEGCKSSLSFFDAAGFRFHLPAYMCLDLRSRFPDGGDLLFHLATHPNEYFELLDEPQRNVARDYLEFLRSVHEQPPDIEPSPGIFQVESAIARLDKVSADSDS